MDWLSIVRLLAIGFSGLEPLVLCIAARILQTQFVACRCMSQSYPSQAEQALRRTTGLPSPWTASDMKFFPDSSVVSDVLPSANYGDRRNGRAPDMIVLHYTGMTDAEVAIRRLTVAGTEVSAHYIVREDGSIIQSVPES